MIPFAFCELSFCYFDRILWISESRSSCSCRALFPLTWKCWRHLCQLQVRVVNGSPQGVMHPTPASRNDFWKGWNRELMTHSTRAALYYSLRHATLFPSCIEAFDCCNCTFLTEKRCLSAFAMLVLLLVSEASLIRSFSQRDRFTNGTFTVSRTCVLLTYFFLPCLKRSVSPRFGERFYA